MSTALPSRWNNRLKAVALGLGLALTAVSVRHWQGTFLHGHPPCEDCQSDFPGFYAAAKLIWQNPQGLYNYAETTRIQKTIDSRAHESFLPFAYPPLMAMVLMPLGWLSFRAAYLAMTVVNAALLSILLTLLIRKLGLSKDQSTWLLLSTFCNFGVHSVLLQGQTSFVVLAYLTGFMLAVQGGRQFWAGFWTGCGLFKPQFLAVPLITLTFQRLWKALVVAGVLLTILCVSSLLLVGVQGIGDYLKLLKFYGTTESGFGSYPRDMHNLRALVQYFVPFYYARYLWLALVAPIAVLTMWLNAKRKESSADVLWAGNFLSMLLLTPHLYPHDLSLMIVPSAFVLKRYGGASVPLHLAGLLTTLGILPILPLVAGYVVPPVLPVVFLAAFVGCAKLIHRPPAMALGISVGPRGQS